MKKTEKKRPTAICTSDWHLRETVPTCRTDDFFTVQWEKVNFISDLQKSYDCPVWHAGDLFHKAKPSPYLLSKTIEHLPKRFFTILGNHDLPQHSLYLVDKCGVYTLEKAGSLTIADGTHWGEELTKPTFILPNTGHKIALYHTMVYQRVDPWPGIDAPKSSTLLRKYPEYSLILTGHNHQTFVEELDGRLLINPGGITRQVANKKEYLHVHEPRVYLWYAETGEYEIVYLPIKENVITREHIEKKEERDGRLSAFIVKLKNDWKSSIGFEENLERMMIENKTRKSVKEIVQKSLD